ncbi:MAG: aspartate/glutamate racemase family protein [Rhodospirillaceae bacterium]|nr:aspartate/glutamate racemase family protein [Rhodospirillaceae bacterium]
MTIAKGGKNVYGAAVGILMLESRFPRIPGDVGNATTWPFPVMFKVVPSASPERVVLQGPDGLQSAFIEAAQELVRTGVDGITTNCGFLALFQDDLASACGVPVASSSLMQVPWVQAILAPGKRVGVLTVSAATLTPAHLTAAGVPADTPVGGTDEAGKEFTRAIIGNEMELDVDLARQDLLDAGRRLVAANPDIGALVLECTNMVPYSADLSAELGMPVFDFYSFVTWFQAGLSPRKF